MTFGEMVKLTPLPPTPRSSGRKTNLPPVRCQIQTKSKQVSKHTDLTQLTPSRCLSVSQTKKHLNGHNFISKNVISNKFLDMRKRSKAIGLTEEETSDVCPIRGIGI